MNRMNRMNFTTDYSNAVDINAVVDGVGSVAGLFKKSDAQKDLKAKCGKKPLLALTKKGKAKKRKFEECRAKLNNPIVEEQPITKSTREPISTIPTKTKSNKNLYIGIGIGVIVIATLVIFRKKIF